MTDKPKNLETPMRIDLRHGDCLDVLRAMVTDPPYGFGDGKRAGFMGKKWDYDVPSVEVWAECLRVLKPGGHLLAFAGTRTQHRMAVRIEDAGFEIRDMIAWVYGSGFPKSLDVSKAIDKMDASEEQERRRLRFTAWVRATGAKSRQIDEATGTNMGGHYTTAASQPAIMTREHLEQCRHLLGDVPKWVEREADIRSVESRNFAEREVVGSYHGATNIGKASDGKRGYGCDGEFTGGTDTTVHITAPATPEARQWAGWGTALKPAMEPITVARKPLAGTVAANVLTHGTGAINVDGCRVGTEDSLNGGAYAKNGSVRHDGDENWRYKREGGAGNFRQPQGRWPANLIHDGSDEVVGLFPETNGVFGARREGGDKSIFSGGGHSQSARQRIVGGTKDSGSAARFFYCAKASKADRDEGLDGFTPKRVSDRQIDDGAGGDNPRNRTNNARKNHHSTVKPTDLMRYLCRLVTPHGGIVLDPFMGSGSTGKGAVLEGLRFIGIEREAEYMEIARARIEAVTPTTDTPAEADVDQLTFAFEEP